MTGHAGLINRGLWDLNGNPIAATPDQLRALADELERKQQKTSPGARLGEGLEAKLKAAINHMSSFFYSKI